MRFVFDTNVLVSALLLKDSKPRKALDRAVDSGRLLLSYAVQLELYEVLHRQRLRRYIGEEEIRNFLAALTREAEWLDVDVQLTVCRDPRDNKFLELAIVGQATHLVTGDSDLLVLNPFRGIAVLTPHSFLELSFPSRPKS